MKASKRSLNVPSDSAAAGSLNFARKQASAYSDLLAVYEARHELLQPIRHIVLDRVLNKLPIGGSVLEVGSGSGASLTLIAERGFNAEGIDLSQEMVLAARTRSGCPVICANFQKYAFRKNYDLVFAQAFVHLFPKTEAPELITKLQSLALRRLYFSTSVGTPTSEGWEPKDGVLRYRSRYTISELHDLISRCITPADWRVEFFELVDPLGKQWVNVIMDRTTLPKPCSSEPQ